MTGAAVDGLFSSSFRNGSISADGAWNSNSDRRTVWICAASSLVGETMMAAT